MRARIVLEMDEKTPLGYLNEFTTMCRGAQKTTPTGKAMPTPSLT